MDDASVPLEQLERRIVTILFADLVGFTTLSEAYDAEDVAAIQERYFGTVRETVARYGGQLEKFIGDAAMAAFGVPRVRDDDAERAVRAGLALVSSVEQIGASMGLDGDALRLRVGINTGEVVIASPTTGLGDARVTGDTVNTAARLQAAAPPGGVLVGQTTALAVADLAELGPISQLELKGKAGTTPARLVSGLRSEPSRDEAMGALRAPTLGREQELATLENAFARSVSGSVERWLVVAPPGVGKSRLLRELADLIGRAGHQAAVWRTRSRVDAVAPFEAIATLMIEALGVSDQARAGELLTRRLAAGGMGDARAAVVREACLSVIWPVDTGADGRPSDERDVLFTAWLDGLDALAGDAAQVWLVEDVHWAGGDVLAFIDHALRGGRRLIITTTRPSLLEDRPTWAAADPDAGRHVMHLATLVPTDAKALIGALVGDSLPAELVGRIAHRSDGNCLFIEELLRTWVSVGALVRDEQSGRWRLAVEADEVALPASVQSIYAAQLDDLPPDARLVARRASVAGRSFPVGALEPLGVPGTAGLEPLRRRELLDGPHSEPITGHAYVYRHALLRDAGYASLARAERARLHVRLARWLEQAAGERSAEVAEQIAGHYSTALESAPALAREIDVDMGREQVRRLAADWYERAAQGTLSLSAHDAARQLFRRAIDLTPDHERLARARRWERLGDATAFAADMDEGAAAYQHAIELYRAAMADGELAQAAGMKELKAGLARATAALSDVMYEQLKFADSRALAARTIEEVGDDDPAALARLLVAQAMGGLGAHGPTPEFAREMERAMQLATDSGDAATELRALRGLTQLRAESGEGTGSEWTRVEQLATKMGDWGAAVQAALRSATSLIDGEPGAVFAAADRARQAAVAHGRTEEAGWADYAEAEAAFGAGDWDRAAAASGRAVDLGQANGYLRLTARSGHVQIPIAAARGDLSTLGRAAAWYASLVGRFEFPDSPYARIIRTAQDLDFAAAGLLAPFVPDVAPRIASFNTDPGGPSWSAALDRVFRAWLEAGEIDGAAKALAELTAALPTNKSLSPLGHGTYELLRARLAEAQADPEAAAAAARVALTHFGAPASPWWMAKAIRLLERVGATDGPLMSEALEIERRLGAVAPTV